MSFDDFQQQAQESRSAAESQRSRLKKSRQELGNVQRRQTQLKRNVLAGQSDAELDRLLLREQAVQAEIADSKSAYANALELEFSQLRDNLAFTNPLDNIAQFDDATPILMFPLRLETRFKQVREDGLTINQLWVRVFPDDIAIDTFESDLSSTEIRNLQRYWSNRWSAGKREQGNRAAWRNLVSSHGPGRAYWMIQQFTPDNLEQEPQLNEGEIILVIAVESMPGEPTLSAVETYWKAVWQANGDNAVLSTAWNDLVVTMGSTGEAQTAIDHYSVANIGDEPPAGRTHETAVVRVEWLDLPLAEDVDTKLHAWAQPPGTTILPERFVFLAYKNGELDMEPQLSELVSPQLIVGPDPSAEQGEDFRLATAEDAASSADLDEGDLIFSEHMRWMFDFEEAVRKGMAFKINLTQAQAQEGFDRILVVGVKLSCDKGQAQTKVEELLEHHHLSRKGMGILKQGTPTNNTEDDRSGYSSRHNSDESFDHYFLNTVDGEATDHSAKFDKPDGRWLEQMLGLRPHKLTYVDNYFQSDICQSLAMQQALWPATMGHFMQSEMNPVFSDEAIENTRLFFNKYVNGRGCIPAIRVGNQPYGILPTTNFTRMRWFLPREPDHSAVHGELPGFSLSGSDTGFLSYLYSILMNLDSVWAGLANDVSYIGKATDDAHQTLLDVIGLHSTSEDVYKRYANTINQIWNTYNSTGYYSLGLYESFPAIQQVHVKLLSALGYTVNEKNPLPAIFEKIFFANPWILNGPRVDTVPNSETDSIRSYTDDDRNYIQWLVDAAKDSHNTLRRQQGFSDGESPTALLYLLLYHALDLSYVDTSIKLKKTTGLLSERDYKKAYIDPEFIGIRTNQENESHWRHLYTPEPVITGDASVMLDRYIPLNLNSLDEAAAFRDSLEAMEALTQVSTASLERTLLEHIDTVSYRYDAWMSGFTHLQLDLMRGISHSDDEDPEGEGVYMGAYGWLENLRPENKNLRPATLPDELSEIFNADGDLQETDSNAGFIASPSLNHAVTAAILRNGQLNAEDSEDAEQLKIKLTSERVRLAVQVIEGMQAGQPLAAILGYQFERGLHDRTDAEVDEFILDLRNLFPLVAKKIEDTTPSDDDPDYESIEQIEANNVLDGVAFLNHLTESEDTTYPFGFAGLPTADAQQSAAINDEVKKLIDTNDAVADLAMSESVHQVVMGNYERASAVLDTYSKGNFPPTPDVIKTPRSGTVLTHRFGLQFRSGISHDIDGAGVTPRMAAEPAINDWLASVLPTTSSMVCVVSYRQQSTASRTAVEVSMNDLGLAPIDLLYMLDIGNEQSMSTLDDFIVQHLLTTPAFDLGFHDSIQIEYTRKLTATHYSVLEVNALMSSLRSLLMNSRHLTPADMRLPNEVGMGENPPLALPASRLQLVLDKVNDLKNGALQTYIGGVNTLLAMSDATAMIDSLESLMTDIRGLFIQAGRYGLDQAGIGFVYQWHQSMIEQLTEKVKELHERWLKKQTKYLELRDQYNLLPGSTSDEDRLQLLSKMEMSISAASTIATAGSPSDFDTNVVLPKFSEFEALLSNDIVPLLTDFNITNQFKGIETLASSIGDVDLTGIDISDQIKQLTLFIEDLQVGASNLSQEMTTRTANAQSLLDAVGASVDQTKNVELVVKAGKALFGDNFVMVPEFSVSNEHGLEWQNALTDSNQILRYLENDLDVDFPVDDWLHGVSRVRRKMYHIENSILHIEGFKDVNLQTLPTQFPYKENDYWLGLQFPDKKDASDEPFTIDEDKLLYTAIYSEPFNPGKAQCGLLIDEWTEMIPSLQETVGLSFHYDQPNSEPPQALLLALPSEFTGQWRWQDLVDSLHSTLEMAKKRAVEPDHIDSSAYNLFLPAVISLTTPTPVTSGLSLALNNPNMAGVARIDIDE